MTRIPARASARLRVTAVDAFARAAAALSRASLDGDLCTPFVLAAEVRGAVICSLGDPLGSEIVGASDPTSAALAEVQFDLGEGPLWEALRTRAAVLESDLQGGAAGAAWPAARDALRRTDAGALFAFPLVVGSIDVGSVGLYRDEAGDLSPAHLAGTTTLAGIAARQVLRRALAALADLDGEYADGPHSRRELHQASGMIAAQLRVSADDGLVILRGHAFAEGRRVLEVAADVIARRLSFAPEDGRGGPSLG